MEGVDTSLMSKVIPASLAMGTFNSGLLATQVGTIGRVLGDLLITGIGYVGMAYAGRRLSS
eukprot:scaffold13_cov241-Pinguiococcus_pyrenoidosus.AAC.22